MTILPTDRHVRLPVILVLLAAALFGLWLVVQLNEQRAADAATPMDIELSGDHAFASLAEGRVVRLTIEGDEVAWTTVADGLRYPRGVAIAGDTLYVAELGDLPCPSPLPRCKGEQVGPTIAEGERTIIDESAGRVLAFPIGVGGELGSPSTVVDGLKFVNADHGLNDLEAGPDGLLYLAVGNLDRLAWDHEAVSLDGLPGTLGTILRIDPQSGTVDVHATGLRNVFGLDFDDAGQLWGVDNDGAGFGPWRFEELLKVEQGLDYGFPDDGTVGPYTRRTGFAEWIMPVGAGSGGILVEGSVVISGGCGRVTRVDLATTSGDAVIRDGQHRGCLTAIERLPDGRLLLASVFGSEPFSLVSDTKLFGPAP